MIILGLAIWEMNKWPPSTGLSTPSHASAEGKAEGMERGSMEELNCALLVFEGFTQH